LQNGTALPEARKQDDKQQSNYREGTFRNFCKFVFSLAKRKCRTFWEFSCVRPEIPLHLIQNKATLRHDIKTSRSLCKDVGKVWLILKITKVV
jgi:hypothetical protein